MRRVHLFVAIFASFSCSRSETRSASIVARASGVTDSIVLERTRCLGPCPAYRLRVSRAGEVFFVSRNPGEDGVSAVDTVEAWVADSIATQAHAIGFFTLPDTIRCSRMASDAPTLTMGLFGRETKRVIYYTGCDLSHDPSMAVTLNEMQQLASRVDTLTGASRWIRPARPR